MDGWIVGCLATAADVTGFRLIGFFGYYSIPLLGLCFYLFYFFFVCWLFFLFIPYSQDVIIFFLVVFMVVFFLIFWILIFVVVLNSKNRYRMVVSSCVCVCSCRMIKMCNEFEKILETTTTKM